MSGAAAALVELRSACVLGQFDRVRDLLSSFPSLKEMLSQPSVSELGAHVDGLLHAACLRDDAQQLEVIEFLVGMGADINGLGRIGQTPLIEACYNDCLNTAKRLIDLGADVGCVDGQGVNAFEADGSGIIEAYYDSFLARQAISRAVNEGFGDGLSPDASKLRGLSL